MTSDGVSWSDGRTSDFTELASARISGGNFSSGPVTDGDSEGDIFEEVNWRDLNGSRIGGRDIAISRWSAAHGGSRAASSVTPSDCHIVSVALRTSRLTLSSDSGPVFEGSMPPGTMHVSIPGQRLKARFAPPFDFLHLHVENRFLCEEGFIRDERSPIECGATPLFRDTLAEALGRSVFEAGDRCRPRYVESVGKAIVMRAMSRQQEERRCRALPKWRMKRLEQHLAANIGRHVSLDDMAAAAGLSKMHFAAQFRAATGFRPHEYLLLKRVEQAKIAMVETAMPLVEVAFSVGFNAQAHFSTVFKRFTGKSPAQWKQEYQYAK